MKFYKICLLILIDKIWSRNILDPPTLKFNKVANPRHQQVKISYSIVEITSKNIVKKDLDLQATTGKSARSTSHGSTYTSHISSTAANADAKSSTTQNSDRTSVEKLAQKLFNRTSVSNTHSKTEPQTQTQTNTNPKTTNTSTTTSHTHYQNTPTPNIQYTFWEKVWYYLRLIIWIPITTILVLLTCIYAVIKDKYEQKQLDREYRNRRAINHCDEEMKSLCSNQSRHSRNARPLRDTIETEDSRVDWYQHSRSTLKSSIRTQLRGWVLKIFN